MNSMNNAKYIIIFLLSLWCDILNIVVGILLYGEKPAPTTDTVAVALIVLHLIGILYLLVTMYMTRDIYKYHLGLNRLFMLVPDIILTVQVMSVVNLDPRASHPTRHMEAGFVAAQVFSWISPFVIIAIIYWSDVRFVRTDKTNKYTDIEVSKINIAEE